MKQVTGEELDRVVDRVINFEATVGVIAALEFCVFAVFAFLVAPTVENVWLIRLYFALAAIFCAFLFYHVAHPGDMSRLEAKRRLKQTCLFLICFGVYLGVGLLASTFGLQGVVLLVIFVCTAFEAIEGKDVYDALANVVAEVVVAGVFKALAARKKRQKVN